jgi:DNA primase
VITSSGGSNAANKADWSPMEGRDVSIWPDNDDAGRHYAAEVAKAGT